MSAAPTALPGFVAAAGGEVQCGAPEMGSNSAIGSPPHGAAHVGGEGIGEVLAEHLLDEIE